MSRGMPRCSACDSWLSTQCNALTATIKAASDAESKLPVLLIAEDNADDLFFLQRLLAQANVRNPVITFADGAKAIEFLQQLASDANLPSGLPCVVLLDIRMPKVQGFEVLAFARQLPAFKDLRIVMLSSSDHPADRKRAKELGANGYFVKLPPAEVMGAIVRGTYIADEE